MNVSQNRNDAVFRNCRTSVPNTDCGLQNFIGQIGVIVKLTAVEIRSYGKIIEKKVIDINYFYQ